MSQIMCIKGPEWDKCESYESRGADQDLSLTIPSSVKIVQKEDRTIYLQDISYWGIDHLFEFTNKEGKTVAICPHCKKEVDNRLNMLTWDTPVICECGREYKRGRAYNNITVQTTEMVIVRPDRLSICRKTRRMVTNKTRKSYGRKGWHYQTEVTMVTHNTRTRMSYGITIMDGKKTIRNVVKLEYGLNITSDEIQEIYRRKFKEMTGMTSVDLSTDVRLNMTRFDGAANWPMRLEKMGEFSTTYTDVRKKIRNFENELRAMPKSLRKFTAYNPVALILQGLSADSMRKICQTVESMTVTQSTPGSIGCSWDYDNWHTVYINISYARDLIKLLMAIGKNENTAVNRVVKWLDENYYGRKYMLGDTVDQLYRLNKQKVDVRPLIVDDLERTHDNASIAVRRLETVNRTIPYSKKEQELNETVDGFTFTLARDTYMLINIGNSMDICVGGYDRQVMNKTSTIVHMTAGDQIYSCIEIQQGKIVQAKAPHNHRLANGLIKIVKKWAANHKLEDDCYDLEKGDNESYESRYFNEDAEFVGRTDHYDPYGGYRRGLVQAENPLGNDRYQEDVLDPETGEILHRQGDLIEAVQLNDDLLDNEVIGF